ncbi:hypothetical protein GTO27_11440 [Candidatus Bathyarchaeota archaeon]|nr:hypothetical protein [Candidatus Bathyarchaeota archaeon]
MAHLRLRDRDAIITGEDLIFRVLGYSHPRSARICDAEYASKGIFKSDNPKAPRNMGKNLYYKFYEDEGWKFITKSFPKYTITHEMVGTKVLGVRDRDILEVRRPDEKLETLTEADPEDELLTALQDVLDFITDHSGLSKRDFGVFGSMLHGFHHPNLSDIDLTVYGSQNLGELYGTLQELYKSRSSVLKNEFEADESIKGKRWKFRNCSLKEYAWHQQRKMIYAQFNDEKSERVIKTEFEPVKDWKEIKSEYDTNTKIVPKGWTKMLARVIDDRDAPFIPSIYGIEPLKVLKGPEFATETNRIVSYLEEFRMQACDDEVIVVEGNLEETKAPEGNSYQVTLTYCPRYYEQVLKIASQAKPIS